MGDLDQLSHTHFSQCNRRSVLHKLRRRQHLDGALRRYGHNVTTSPLYVRMDVESANTPTLGNVSVSNGEDVLEDSQFFDKNVSLGAGNLLVNLGKIGIGTTTTWGNLSVQAPANSSAPEFVVGSSTATSLFVSNSGNIGIGTASPPIRSTSTVRSTSQARCRLQAGGQHDPVCLFDQLHDPRRSRRRSQSHFDRELLDRAGLPRLEYRDSSIDNTAIG